MTYSFSRLDAANHCDSHTDDFRELIQYLRVSGVLIESLRYVTMSTASAKIATGEQAGC
jgi:hypothetical protein